ncbi:chorismate mutase [Streptomyces sp. LP11]|uniref:chorismate mutase n=1 Tax=Streptomyces pyxinicus TaxID=2970331 RepID=A0ABT2B3K5_9ACTN|nr:chorismate mutase [Streptomyces sp. LP11]MCS0602956.1 chorismate mutase [Streptomyces sp. LP11]
MSGTVRAVRGATGVRADTRQDIRTATEDLVRELLGHNGLAAADVEALFFTVTPDLTADIPPLVLQERGVLNVPCLCSAEPRWDGEMPRVIRVMALVHADRDASLEPVYLSGAAATRP